MKAITIAHLFPDLLNLYGDGGNVRCLQKRCEWRGLPVDIISVKHGQTIDLSLVDIVFLGGGPDREQKLASEQLLAMKKNVKDYVENDGVLLAICGGYQLLGKEWLLGNESVEGLGVLDMTTKHVEGRAKRLIDNIILQSDLCSMPVVGYENHAGRTFLGTSLRPFGQVISSTGHGNNDTDGQDGALYRHVLGTYLHGPLLGKNPQVADCLLQWVANVRAMRNEESFALENLNDSVEKAANDYVLHRFSTR